MGGCASNAARFHAVGVRRSITHRSDLRHRAVADSRVVPYVGGAFGSKGQTWSHVALAAMAAKLVERPVKLIVTRPQMFGWIGHRPQTEQRIALGARRDGRLMSVSHDVLSETSISDEFVEACGVFSRDLYAVGNYRMSHQLPRLNISKPTYQRGPGESTGSFAMESAMDELAYELQIDPIELRLVTTPSAVPTRASRKQQASAPMLPVGRGTFPMEPAKPQTALDAQRARAGWACMATASRATHRSAASARITMHDDGPVLVECGTIEQGCGTPTVYAQLAASILDIPFERVRFEFGSTDLPPAPVAAGSQTSGSVGSLSRSDRRSSERSSLQTAAAYQRAGSWSTCTTSRCRRRALRDASFRRSVRASRSGFRPRHRSCHALRRSIRRWRISTRRLQTANFWAAWCGESAWRSSRRRDMTGARGGHERRSRDYLVPTNADIPDPELIFVEEDDPHINPAHVKGIGEVGLPARLPPLRMPSITRRAFACANCRSWRRTS